MHEDMFRIAGVILGCGAGAGSGWAATRVFSRSFVQDVSATLIGWLLGSIVMVIAEIAAVMSQSAGGLGSVSMGLSEAVLFGLPIAVLLAAAAHWVRRRVSRTSVVPIVLGGLAALLGATLSPVAAVAQSKTAFLGRLPCADAAGTLRQGTFTLPVGQVRLRDGRACIKASAGDAGCEWSVALVRSDVWGEKAQYLVAVVEALHDGPGAWLSVLVYRCDGDRHQQVFAESYGPRGAGLVLGAASTFDVIVGEPRPEDPGCCPSRERRNRYAWDDRRKRFTLVESKVTAIR